MSEKEKIALIEFLTYMKVYVSRLIGCNEIMADSEKMMHRRRLDDRLDRLCRALDGIDESN